MRDDNRKIEEAVITTIVISLLILTIIVFEKTAVIPFNEITGEVASQVNIIKSLPSYCNFTLEEGLNLVSFFCIANGMPIDDVIVNLTLMEGIFEYQEGQFDSWKTYNPNLPSFVIHDLNDMKRIKGYWVLMNAQEAFVFEGSLRLPSHIPLSPGWNLAGHPTNKTKLVNDSFVSIEGNMTEARKYDAVNDVFLNYIPGVGGGLTHTQQGEGYWVNITTNEMWEFYD